DELPLTTSGKLNRKALPQPELAAHHAYTAPRNAVEQTLAAIWQDVLQVQGVGIHDNYFGLGGDSILSIQIISRAKQAGLKLRVEDLFLAQSIAELAMLAQTAGITHTPIAESQTDQYPLTPTQTGILFHALYEPGSALYCQQVDLVLAGHLHAGLFQQAWRAVFDRHDALRMVFVWENTDQPYQHINPVANLSWTDLDWRGLGATEQQQRYTELMQQQADQGFAVSLGPLAHFTLVCLGDRQYRLLWSYHHLLMDGWSLPLVLGDVASHYAALSAGGNPQPERHRPFADYVAWLAGQDLQSPQVYWQRRLAPISAATSIPCAGHDAPERPYGHAFVDLDAEFSDELRAFVRRRHLTLAVVLQAAWALLLNRYSGETDVVFGITVSGRPADLQGIESVVGLFINTLPVVAKVDDAAEVASWLQELAAEQFKREPYGYVPLSKITEWSPLPAGQALIQSLLVLENYPLKTALGNTHSDGLHIVDAQFTEQTNYPLTWVIVPDERIHIKAMYQTQAFDTGTVTRLLRHFRLALAFLVQSSTKTLGAFEVLQGAERQLQLHDWNATDYDGDGFAHENIPGLLTRQAQQTPDHPALIFNGATLSYGELECRANRLAHYLQKQG
ncbi:MAG: condensation domain-containing protein, partial [Aquabacterium sp.]|uniref:condensation domain-containing protein n=1 Tax=Aquabacterium sp. TaxID=1872578 RepID=UPI002716FC8B